MTTALRFLPPLAWSVLIAWFSGAGGHGGATTPLFEPWLRALLPWAAPEQIAQPRLLRQAVCFNGRVIAGPEERLAESRQQVAINAQDVLFDGMLQPS